MTLAELPNVAFRGWTRGVSLGLRLFRCADLLSGAVHLELLLDTRMRRPSAASSSGCSRIIGPRSMGGRRLAIDSASVAHALRTGCDCQRHGGVGG